MNNWTLLQMLGVIPGQREIFEDICRKVVRVEHPCTRSLREHKGDHGIDFFVGDLQTGIDVYQVKFFREEVGDSQRAQIRESYDRILEKKEHVKSWTLMLPLELSYEEMQWFERWEKKKDHDIRLVTGFQLEEKLKRPEYRDAARVLSTAFSMAGLRITWSERPTPILKAVFGITDPFRSETYKVDTRPLYLSESSLPGISALTRSGNCRTSLFLVCPELKTKALTTGLYRKGIAGGAGLDLNTFHGIIDIENKIDFDLAWQAGFGATWHRFFDPGRSRDAANA
jgi:hypothetical protein